jgi:hypothetical protein
MTMEDNKELVLRFYRGFDDRRMEDSMNLLAPNFLAYMAGLPDANGDTWLGAAQ